MRYRWSKRDRKRRKETVRERGSRGSHCHSHFVTTHMAKLYSSLLLLGHEYNLIEGTTAFLLAWKITTATKQTHILPNFIDSLEYATLSWKP